MGHGNVTKQQTRGVFDFLNGKMMRRCMRSAALVVKNGNMGLVVRDWKEMLDGSARISVGTLSVGVTMHLAAFAPGRAFTTDHASNTTSRFLSSSLHNLIRSLVVFLLR
jgi:hypothetical protein